MPGGQPMERAVLEQESAFVIRRWGVADLRERVGEGRGRIAEFVAAALCDPSE